MRKVLLILAAFLLSLTMTGCLAENTNLDPKNPTTLSIWHVYGDQTKSPFNDAIDRFNRTVGRDKGVIIRVLSITTSYSIDKGLVDAAKKLPGAAEMPDLFIAYPRVANTLPKNILLDWNNYLSKEERANYIEAFLSEGYIDGQQLMLPIAKSSEVLFLNQTLFDRFSAQNNIDTSGLLYWETLLPLCNKYYDWSGGKYMFKLNDTYHYFVTEMMSRNPALNLSQNSIDVHSTEFAAAFYPFARAAIYGGLCLEHGFASDLWKTADVISSTGSTAEVLYLRDDVTYSNGVKEKITLQVFPYPKSKFGKSVAIQRGGGLFATKSDDERKNKAAAVFAKWITSNQENLSFTMETGYIPVNIKATESLFANYENVSNPKYRNLYHAVSQMYNKYHFCSTPLSKSSQSSQKSFENALQKILTHAHAEFKQRSAAGENREQILDKLISESLTKMQKELL